MGSVVERVLPAAVLRRPRSAYLEILGWWLCSRVLVFVCALILNLHLLGRRIGYFGAREMDHFLGLLGAWDGRWYAQVAAHGYLLVPGRQSDPAFFPLLPVLMRIGNTLGVGFLFSGVVLSNLAFPVALLALYRLGTQLLPEPTARRAAIYAALFPMGFVFSMAYPQSVALLGIALASLLAARGSFVSAAFVAAAATLGRPEALFVAVPLAAIAVRAWPDLSTTARGRAVAAVAAAPVALLAYPLYLRWALHDAQAWSKAQTAWGRSFGVKGVVHAVHRLPAQFQLNPWIARDVVALLLYGALFFAAARAGVPRAWLASGALVLLVPLMSGSVLSEARFGLLALPLYWGMAVLGTTVARDRAITAGSLALLAAGTLTLPYAFP
ncbi:MAG: hypothetical protein WBB76_12225 [Gaiellaceae bacterium]